MPAKRRTSKVRDRRIPPEAVEVFKLAMSLGQIYHDCLHGKACLSEQPGREHCTDCRAFIDASNQLDRLLGIKPWEPCVLHAKGDCPWAGDGTAYSMSWPKIRELREELERLARG